jgi:hypothetical protein
MRLLRPTYNTEVFSTPSGWRVVVWGDRGVTDEVTDILHVQNFRNLIPALRYAKRWEWLRGIVLRGAN